ncbi:MAG: hypothetical protein NTZ67_09570 [Gammaproteobacteria bacterium]|nr:hypothetical protein [Gammaproteobacteria bacterium]
MSRQADATVKTGDSKSAVVKHDLADFTCPVTQSLFFDPVSGCNPNETCGHTFEKKECVGKLQKCPCCREDITLFSPALHTKNTLDEILFNHPELWQDVYFNLDHFTEIFTKENGLKTQNGIRFLRLLSHASNHLNDKAIEGAQKGKSAIEILASTETGLALMRKYFNIKVVEGKEKYYFGNAEIFAESLKIQVNGESIQAWLYPSVDLVIQKEEAMRAKIEAEESNAFNVFIKSKLRLFSPAADQANSRSSCDSVNDILQQVVYGQRAKVREMLDKIKRENPALLKEVLTSVATQPIYDYSGKKIEDMKLLEAAAAANAVAIHPELAADPDHQEMCEIIQSYFDSTDQTDQAEITEQYKTVLKRSLERQGEQLVPGKENDLPALLTEHQKAQEKNTFDFSKIIAAITRAGSAPDQITAALNKVGARFDEADDATRAKSDDQLTLTESLNRFREQFEKHALKEVIINPHHLLKALQDYIVQYDRWNSDDQRRLFIRLVYGFVQRYLSAQDARVFAYGLVDSVENKHKVPDHFNFRFDPGYQFYPHVRSCSGLGFDYCAGRAGWPLHVARASFGTRGDFTKLMSSKNISFGKLMRPSKSHQPRSCSLM